MTTLTLVRHGQTDWNHARRIQGSTDIPLNDTGRDQARAAADLLRRTLGDTSSLVVAASDLSRAAETAGIIADTLAVAAPLTYPQLRERGYGEAEGMAVDEFLARFGDWTSTEVPGAEPADQLRARAVAGLRQATADARRRTAPQAPSLVIVSHGALIRELIRHATGGAFPAAHERLANGSLHTFLVERDRLRLLEYAAV